ncbi:MAG: nucleoside triphosphate pyrophosphatase [Pseudomonadota bacterium]
MKKLVLASTSPYRAQQLRQLGVSFETASPVCDETPNERESASQLVQRLSTAKAQSVAKDHPNALIIGGDQVAERDGRIIGKPGDRANAVAQLSSASGRSMMFYSGVCVHDTATSQTQVDKVTTQVQFRTLNGDTINRYIDAENPIDCAGSFKSEGLGIALFQSVGSDDPSALMGLPLIRLVSMLGVFGFSVP